MENMVKLQIDGRDVESPAGINIIEAARLGGIHVPNLCYLRGMKGIGACRLCLVEVEGLKAPVIACNTNVREGMVIRTNTERVSEIRKFVIELILSMHPLDCMTCTKAGICNLQKYAYDFGIKESTFLRKKFGYPADETNPFIKRDPEYCIMCGRCVRVCREQGTKVLDFMGRGIDTKVVTALDRPLQESGCTFCGSCVDVCPVNALLEADRWRKGREWEYERIASVCLMCGGSCDITASIHDGMVCKISAGATEGSSERFVCAYGRFGFDALVSGSRITVPMKRIDGELRETTWEDALEIVAGKLKEAGDQAGFVSVANLMNEDALTLKRLAVDAVKTPHFDTTLSLYADSSSFLESQTAAVDDTDLFLLVGINPCQWKRVLPALDSSLRRRVNRGAGLIVINSSETGIAGIATVNIKGNEASVLKGIVKALFGKGLKGDKKLRDMSDGAEITAEVETAATLIQKARNPLILSSPSLFGASLNVALLKGKAVAVGFEANSRGTALMGLATDGKTYKEMVSGGMKVLYAIGEVPLAKRPDSGFLVVQNAYKTELAQQADIVLPSAATLESSGTVVDSFGRMKHLSCVTVPFGESRVHRDIFISLSGIMGTAIKKPGAAEIKRAVRVRQKLTASPFEKRDDINILPDSISEDINSSVIISSRLAWLRESAKVQAV